MFYTTDVCMKIEIFLTHFLCLKIKLYVIFYFQLFYKLCFKTFIRKKILKN